MIPSTADAAEGSFFQLGGLNSVWRVECGVGMARDGEVRFEEAKFGSGEGRLKLKTSAQGE